MSFGRVWRLLFARLLEKKKKKSNVNCSHKQNTCIYGPFCIMVLNKMNKETLQNTSNKTMLGHQSFYLAPNGASHSQTTKGCLPLSVVSMRSPLTLRPPFPSFHSPHWLQEQLNHQLLEPTALKLGGLSNYSHSSTLFFPVLFLHVFPF